MPKIVRTQQISFDRGMIENIRQNALYESNPASINSLLWLENWLGNKEAMTLVKRNGEIRYEENTFNFDFNYNQLIESYNSDFSPIYYAGLIRSVNPIQYSQFTLICSLNASIEQIKVYAVEPRVLNNVMVLGHNGLWHNPIDDDLDYKGLEIVNGTLGDVAKYGDILLFSTYSREKDYTGNWYPCYILTRFDISKKRKEGLDRYWNGLYLPDVETTPVLTNNNNHLYIKPPTQSLKDIVKSVRRREISGGVAKYYDEDEVEETAINGFTLYFQEELSGERLSTDPQQTIYSNGFIQNHTMSQYVSSYNGDHSESVNTILSFDTPKYKWYRDLLAAIGVTTERREAFSTYTNTFVSGGTTYNFEDIREVLGILDLTYYSSLVLVHILPDYISAKVPRCWTKEDNIPFVVTLTIGGVEYLFYEDNYIVRNHLGSIIDFAEISQTYSLELRKYGLTFALESLMGLYQDRAVHSSKTVINSPYIVASVNTYPPPNTTFGNHLYFGIRLTKETLDKFIEIGVTSVNLYVSKPSTTRHIVDYTGVISINPIPPTLYSLPVTDENTGDTDYSQYALVNRFVIEGEGVYDPTDEYDLYKPGYYNMNGWAEEQHNCYIAIPQDKTYGTKNTVIYREYSSVVDKANSHTPNFILWDYPSESTPLTLQGTGKYWEGKGARLIHTVQGRTFLAGCIDENGIEEQGIVRFSQIQSGNISPDLFNDEDKIRVGFLSHTAFAQFREQLWLFNRQTWYQIIIPMITDYSQWEFVNAIDGQGTFSPKTICTTPFGICFANENGIWITDGGKPECLTYTPEKGLAVKNLYQHLATNQSYVYTSLIALGNSPIDSNLGYNTSMELEYNEEENELTLITPIESTAGSLLYDTELRLIYSFANSTWRIETFALPTDVITYSNIHRVHFSYNKFFHTRLDSNNKIINFGHRTNVLSDDIYSIANMDTTKEITGQLYTHEIGNGKNDYILHSGILEVQSKDLSYDYYVTTDPKLEYQRRNIDWATQSTTDYDWEDLIAINMAVKGDTGENPFISLSQTPSSAGHYNLEDLEFVVGRESLHLLAPLNSKFRRMKMRLISEKIVKIRNITVNIVEMQRKGWG